MFALFLFACVCITLWATGWTMIDMVTNLAANIKFWMWKRTQ